MKVGRALMAMVFGMLLACAGTAGAVGIELKARQTHGFNIRIEIKIFDKMGYASKPVELTLQDYEVKDPAEKSWNHLTANLRPISHWAGAAWEVPMPTLDAFEKPFVIKVDGNVLATMKVDIEPKVFKWLDGRVQEIQVVFEPAVLSDSKLPVAKLADESLARTLLGDCKIEGIKFIDSKGNEVTSATKSGRYGGIATLKSVKGKEIKCYKTLFRLSADYQPEGTDAEKAQIKAALDAGDKSHATAALLAAVRDRINGEDAWVDPDSVDQRDKRFWLKIRGRVLGETVGAFYTYRPHLPPDYDADKTKLWPLLVYFHGGGLGDEGAYLQRGALGFMFQGAGAEKFIKIAPFCYNGDWDRTHMAQFLNSVECQYRVDHNKIFVLGHSAGGAAVVNLTTASPRSYAGVILCAAAGKSILPGEAQNFKAQNTAVWLFAGEQDPRPMANADWSFINLMSVGAFARYSRLPGVGHGCDHYALRGGCPDLYKWMLSLDKSRPVVNPEDKETGQWIARDPSGVVDGPKADSSWQTPGAGTAGAGYKWFEVYHKLQPPSTEVIVRRMNAPSVPAPAAPASKPDSSPEKPRATPVAAKASKPAQPQASGSALEVRTWTSASGKTVEASLQGFAEGKAMLRRADGTLVRIPLEKLSEQDQAYLKQAAVQ